MAFEKVTFLSPSHLAFRVHVHFSVIRTEDFNFRSKQTLDVEIIENTNFKEKSPSNCYLLFRFAIGRRPDFTTRVEEKSINIANYHLIKKNKIYLSITSISDLVGTQASLRLLPTLPCREDGPVLVSILKQLHPDIQQC